MYAIYEISGKLVGAGYKTRGEVIEALCKPDDFARYYNPEYGAPLEINPAAVSLGRLGGKSTSKAKAAAARANGRKGGRPRKSD